jgi:hypothetical protein
MKITLKQILVLSLSPGLGLIFGLNLGLDLGLGLVLSIGIVLGLNLGLVGFMDLILGLNHLGLKFNGKIISRTTNIGPQSQSWSDSWSWLSWFSWSQNY